MSPTTTTAAARRRIFRKLKGATPMRGAVLHAPGDVRLERRDDPSIIEPTDAVISLPATCICGSDLWPYRGIEAVDGPAPMGHDYVGIDEAVGRAGTNTQPG